MKFIPGIIFDFFLPTVGMAFEIDGAQHKKYVPFFHKTKSKFRASQHRDNDKQCLCEINSWTLYRVSSVQEMETLLKSC